MTALESKLQALVRELKRLRQGWDDLADAMNGRHSFDFRCGLQQCEAELGLFIPKLEALLAERQEPPDLNALRSEMVRTLGANTGLSFNQAMQGLNALWPFIERLLAAAPSSGTGEKK